MHAHVRPDASGYELGGLSLALGLVRPELNVAAVLLLALTLARARAPQRAALARGVGLAYLLPGAVYFAARAAYYGHLLPIPFHEKIAGGSLFPAAANALAFGQVLLASCALFAAIPTLLAPRAVAPAWLAIGAVVAVGLLPDPVMDFDYRYCMPAAPVAFALAGAGFARLALLVAALRPAQRAIVPCFTAAAIALVIASASEPARLALRERRGYGQALAGTYFRLGHVLADYRRGAARPPVLAIGDAGAIPYYSGLRVIDTYSLNDPGDRDRRPRRSRVRARSEPRPRGGRLRPGARIPRRTGPIATTGRCSRRPRARHAAGGDPHLQPAQLPLPDGAAGQRDRALPAARDRVVRVVR